MSCRKYAPHSKYERQLIVRLTVAVCVYVPFLPVMVSVTPVCRVACGFAEIVRVEVPVAVAGFGEKVAVTFEGTPEMLSVTELLAPIADRLIVTEVRRLTLMAAGAEIVKSPDGGFTVSDSEVV